MRFPALKCSFPKVFVHIFTPFSSKVKQNKTERASSAGLGVALWQEVKSFIRNLILAKPKQLISQCQPGSMTLGMCPPPPPPHPPRAWCSEGQVHRPWHFPERRNRNIESDRLSGCGQWKSSMVRKDMQSFHESLEKNQTNKRNENRIYNIISNI